MQSRTHRSAALPIALSLLCLLLALVALPNDGRRVRASGPTAELPTIPPTDQILIGFQPGSDPQALPAAAAAQQTDRLSEAAGVELQFLRPVMPGAYVYKLPSRMSEAAIRAIAAGLDELPEVAYAEPDAIMQILGGPAQIDPRAADLVPDDPDYAAQWHYRYTAGSSEGVNLVPAWNITTGSAGTVVAVIDTGILPHADLAGRTVPGYDFIAPHDDPFDPNDDPLFVANDGNGRDPDPSDPGDWIAANECGFPHNAQPSSWHGTHVAGTIGANSDNNMDVAGINWQAKILPVRVLGRCGGFISDIVPAIRWAAGLPVAGVPANANPADVINLSLGGFSFSCAVTYQLAFDEVTAAGTTVAVAAGNNGGSASGVQPGNCDKVITVASNDRAGNKAGYSSYGSVVEISAPGGDTVPIPADGVLSTLNTGATVPAADAVAFYQGTSMATPHVAGVVSLMLAVKPNLTPGQALEALQQTARPFPNGSTCNPGICGPGIVDAFGALTFVSNALNAPTLISPADGASVLTDTVDLDWSAVAGADGYRLHIASDPAFSVNLMEIDVAGHAYSAGPLVNGNYYWRAQALDNGAPGFLSETRLFNIAVPPPCLTPGVPSLSSPADGASTTDTTPQFQWAAAAEATGYEFVIADNPGLSNPVLQSAAAGTIFTPGSPLFAGDYFWAVRSRNQSGPACDKFSDWSEARSLTIEADPLCGTPGVPAPAVPDDGATLADSTPSFGWAPADNAPTYQLVISTSPDLSSPVAEATTTAVIFTLDDPLPDGLFYWAVRGLNQQPPCNQAGDWSSTRSFSVDAERLFLPVALR